MGRLAQCAPAAVVMALVAAVVVTGCGEPPPKRAPAFIEASPATLDFGAISPGSSLARTVTVSNAGTGELSVEQLVIVGDAASQFVLEGVGQKLLRAGETATLTVHYQPQASGAHNARLLIQSDADNTAELVVSLTGVADACTGKTCGDPPGQCRVEQGTCADGVCVYADSPDGTGCDDDNPCTENDACSAGTCAGTPKTCTTPPANECVDGSTFRTHSEFGMCDAVTGACQYEWVEQTCSGGCSNATCAQDPCAQVTCDMPPATECISSTELRTYSAGGTCSQGACSYAATDTTCPSPANAMGTCANATCGFACLSGFRDCSGTCRAEDDPAFCGVTCVPCGAPPNATPTCTSGTCGFVCNPGFHDCGGQCVPDSSTASCGSSCTPCVAPANATSICTGGTCGFVCDPGFHDCGGQCVPDSSVNSCGSSCTPCTVPANGTATCLNGACGVACNSGYSACNGGCTTNLTTESCDSADNDCDGFVDEGCGLGTCASPFLLNPQGGTVTAQMNGTGSVTGSCNTYASGGIERVYKWVPTQSGTAVLNNTTDYWSAALYVKQGSCTGSVVACTSSGGPWPNMTLNVPVTAGQTYFIVVDAYYNGPITLTYTLNVTPP